MRLLEVNKLFCYNYSVTRSLHVQGSRPGGALKIAQFCRICDYRDKMTVLVLCYANTREQI